MLYYIAVLVMMCSSMRLYFTWFIPQTIELLLYLFAGLFYITFCTLHISKDRVIAAAIIILVFIYEGLTIYEVSILAWLQLILRIFLAVCLILSPIEVMSKILKLIIKFVASIILLSLFFWCLFLLGVSLPHYSTVTGNYYEHTVYYFFLLNGDESQLIYRFAGMFLEPGHVGSTSCFLLFLNGMTPRKWENIVFYLAILLSLSLAAYGLLVGCIGLYIIFKYRGGILKVFFFSLFLFLLAIIFTNYNGGDNPINEKILLRLVFENGEMSGSNRTTSLFDMQYDRYIRTSEAIWGKGRSALESNTSTNIVNGCASWKRYLFLRGYIGFFLILIFLVYYCYCNRTKQGISFFIIYLVCNSIRDYPIDEMWLYLFILSMPLYKYRMLE